MPAFTRRKKRSLKINKRNTGYGKIGTQAALSAMGIAGSFGRAAYEKAYNGLSTSTSKTFKKGGSRTIVARKRNPSYWQQSDNGNLSYLTHVVKYKPSKIFGLHNKLSSVARHSRISTGANNSGYGLQRAADITDIRSPDLKLLFRALNDDLVVNANKKAKKFSVNTLTYEIEFSNPSPTAVEVDIYFLIDKVTSITASIATATWGEAMVDEQGPGPITSPDMPWAKPTEMKRFNIQYWTRRFTRTMPSGSKIKITFRHHVNRLLDYEYLDRFESIRGITSQVMVVQRGVTGDSENDWDVVTAPAPIVTLSRTKLIWVTKLSFTGQMLAVFPKITQQAGALSTNPVTFYEQEGDGDVVPVHTNTEFA